MGELLVIIHGTDALLEGLGYSFALEAPGDVERMDAELRGIMPEITGWSYNTDLTLHVPDGTVIPTEELSRFGTVEVLDLDG